jgi:hypothetical protein
MPLNTAATTVTVWDVATSTELPATVEGVWDVASGTILPATVEGVWASVGTDSTDPTAPTGVTVSALDSSVRVTWTAPTNTTGVTGYRVRTFSGTSTTVLQTATAGTADRSWTVTGLTNGQSYSFDVTMTTSSGFGVVSTRSSVATPQAPVVGAMVYGDSGDADLTSNLAVHGGCFFRYNGGSTSYRWSSASTGVPDSADLFISLNGMTTAAQFDAFFDSMPATRSGRVYVIPFQEPENDMTAAAYVTGNARTCFDSLNRQRAAGRLKYTVKSSCNMAFYTVKKIDASHPAPVGYLSDWVTADQEHVGWSVYADVKVSNGHVVAGSDPVALPTKIADGCKALGLPYSAFAWGFAIANGGKLKDGTYADNYIEDAQSHANRVSWMRTSAATMTNLGFLHAAWYNRPWTNGDYAFYPRSNYPADVRAGITPNGVYGTVGKQGVADLYAAWQDLLTGSGQYTGSTWPALAP